MKTAFTFLLLLIFTGGEDTKYHGNVTQLLGDVTDNSGHLIDRLWYVAEIRGDLAKRLEDGAEEPDSVTLGIASAEVLTDGIDILCESLNISEKSFSHILEFGDTYFELEQKYLSVDADRVTGFFLGRYAEGEKIHLNGGGIARSLCISLCGLRCPKGGLILDKIDISERNRIRISSPSVSIFGLRIPLFFFPRSFDRMGKSPGLLPPSLSLSRKHGTIAGISVFVPLSFFFTELDADIKISEKYFSKTNIFLSELVISSPNFSSSFVLAPEDIFSITIQGAGKYGVKSSKFFISVNSELFSGRFISEIPADIRKASMPFSFFTEELEYITKLGQFDINLNQNIYFYLEHITPDVRSFLFSDLELSVGLGVGEHSAYVKGMRVREVGIVEMMEITGEIVPGFILLRWDAHHMSPFLKGAFKLGNFSLMGRLGINNFTLPIRDFPLFLPPGVPFYFYREFFASPSFVSISYSVDYSDYGFLFSPFSSLSLAEKFFHMNGPFFIPSAGVQLIYHRIFFDISFGFITALTAPAQGETFLFSSSNSSFNILIFPSGRLSADVSVYTMGSFFLTSFSLPFSSKYFSTKPSFSITNSADVFTFRSTSVFNLPATIESFFAFDILFVPYRDISIDISSILYSVFRPVQIGIGLNYDIRRICASLSVDGVYNFVSGEPRISFSFNLRI